jgi:hypothetical protein
MNHIVHNCTCGNCIKARYTFPGGYYIYEFIHELNSKLNELDYQMSLDIEEIEKEKKKSKLANKMHFDMEIQNVKDNYTYLKNVICDGYFIYTPENKPLSSPPLPPPNSKKIKKGMKLN